VAKVLLFPADTVALGPLVSNVATDSWWGPYMPIQADLEPTNA
jgi:branched-chain amino acid transport system substrate-binding protein